MYTQLNLDKSDCQGKQEFVRLIEVLTYQGLHLLGLNFASKCLQSTSDKGVDIQVGFRPL